MAATTYLQLCQLLMEEAGISGTITTTENQVGELKRVVGWVARATKEIEGMWANWNFLHEFHSFPTIVGVSDYPAPPTLNLWDWAAFSVSDYEQPLEFMKWVNYKRDATAPIAGDPYQVVILPNKSVRLIDTPTQVVTIKAHYWTAPTQLILSADEPKIPAQFRDIIAYKALQYYANYESSDEAKTQAQELYAPIMMQLESSELPAHQSSGSVNTGVQIQVVGASGLDY